MLVVAVLVMAGVMATVAAVAAVVRVAWEAVARRHLLQQRVSQHRASSTSALSPQGTIRLASRNR